MGYLELTWSPYNVAIEPQEVFSPQNLADHEALFKSRHVGFHVILSSNLSLGNFFLSNKYKLMKSISHAILNQ